MISAEENNLLTQIGPETSCGGLLRRYWQPVALTEELPEGGAPVKVKILSEELVLFRDDQKRPGLLGLHCSHRGTDLSYGRVEAGDSGVFITVGSMMLQDAVWSNRGNPAAASIGMRFAIRLIPAWRPAELFLLTWALGRRPCFRTMIF